MNPDDLRKFFDAAFEKIQPKDDAQRQKLDGLREMLRTSNAELAEQMKKIEGETELMTRPTDGGFLATAHDRVRIAEETRAVLGAAFDEQADIIARIAARGGGRRL